MGTEPNDRHASSIDNSASSSIGSNPLPAYPNSAFRQVRRGRNSDRASTYERMPRRASDGIVPWVEYSVRPYALSTYRYPCDTARPLLFQVIPPLGSRQEIEGGATHGEITTAVFIDSDDEPPRRRTIGAAARLRAVLGLDGDNEMAEAGAVKDLIESLSEFGRAAVRVGSTLVVKYRIYDESVVLVRHLSQTEFKALTKYPEIQQRPENVFHTLSVTVSAMDSATGGQP